MIAIPKWVVCGIVLPTLLQIAWKIAGGFRTPWPSRHSLSHRQLCFLPKKRCRQNSRVVWGISQYFICHNMSQLRAHEFHKHRRNRKNRGTNTWQQFKGKTLYTSTGLVPSGASAPPPVHLFSAAPVSDSPALYLTWPAMLWRNMP